MSKKVYQEQKYEKLRENEREKTLLPPTETKTGGKKFGALLLHLSILSLNRERHDKWLKNFS